MARFNARFNNRIQGVYAWLTPPWAVIVHTGRRSGRRYRTPVLAFQAGDALVVALLYGESSDWLANLRAHGGHVVRAGRTLVVGRPVVLQTGDAPQLQLLPAAAQAYCRLADKQAILELKGRRPGFGPGPR